MDLDVMAVDCCKRYCRIHWKENDHEKCLAGAWKRFKLGTSILAR